MQRQRLLLSLIVTLLLGVAVVVALLASLDLNRFKPEIEAQVEAATGRKLAIAGDLGLALSLTPRLTVDGATLANATWGSQPQMLSVGRLTAEVELLPLLIDKRLKITRLILQQPELLLERRADGIGNWQLATARPEADKQSGAGLPEVNDIRIEQARITYLDATRGERRDFSIERLQGSAAAIDAPLALELSGRLDGKPLQLSATAESLATLIVHEATRIEADLRLGDNRIGGVFTLTHGDKRPRIEAKLSGDRLDLRELLPSDKGKDEPATDELPPLTLLSTIDGKLDFRAKQIITPHLALDGVSFNAVLDNGVLRLDKLALNFADNRIEGVVTLVAGGKRPRIEATVASERLDLRELLPSDSNGDQPPTEKEKLFSSTPLPLAALHGIDGRLDLSVKQLLGPTFALNGVTLSAMLDNGLLSLDPFTLNAGGGELKSTMSLNSRHSPASAVVRLKGRSINLGNMLAEVGIDDLLSDGITRIELDLRGEGDSVAALMASLDGSALLEIGHGKLNNRYANLAGADLLNQLLSALNPLARSESLTALECAVVNVVFKDGVSTFERSVAAETDKMTVVGSGSVDLAQEQLDIGMVPKPRKDSIDLGIGAGDLVRMARIQGSLVKPELGLDAASTAKAGLKVYSAIATGGTSLLLGGLLDKAITDAHPCQTALEKQFTAEGKPESGGLIEGVKGLLGN